MKSKHTYLFLIIIVSFLVSCSEFNEDLREDFLNDETPENLISGPLSDFNSEFPEFLSDFNSKYPVINITVNQEEFDDMYLNFTKDIEIEAYLNLYRNKTLLISNELVEIEIKGSFSAGFDLKSLGIKFDDAYNNENRSLLNPETILPNHSLEEIKAFRLRNSGNDFTETLLKDISYTQLAINAGLNIDLTYYEPTIVFINNAFSGIMNLRSEGNTNGMSRLNNVKKENITLAKIVPNGEVEKKDGDFDRIDNFLNAIEEKQLDYLKDEIDIDNFIDYMIFQSYIANVDWLYNNVRFYAVNDGPFRFVMYDLDWANIRKLEDHPLDFIRSPTLFSVKDGIDNPITDLFNILYNNDFVFKTQFNDRYVQLLNDDAFSSQKFNNIVDKNFNAIHQYMPYHVDKYSAIETMIEWYINVDELKHNFERREKNVKSLGELF